MRYLYIITSGPKTIKVGIATNPKHRLKILQTGSSSKLKLFATFPIETDIFSLETSIHRRLSAFSLQGEWFAVTPAEAAAIVTAVISAGPPKDDSQDARIADAAARSAKPRHWPKPTTLICPKCSHSSITELPNSKIWHAYFRCIKCSTRTEGRRFFIRKVA